MCLLSKNNITYGYSQYCNKVTLQKKKKIESMAYKIIIFILCMSLIQVEEKIKISIVNHKVGIKVRYKLKIQIYERLYIQDKIINEVELIQIYKTLNNFESYSMVMIYLL